MISRPISMKVMWPNSPPLSKITNLDVQLTALLGRARNELPHDKTNKMTCAPSEDRSAWTSARSDQSLRCLHDERLGP